jgi:tetratricopeptide (TPR) repeat protein
MRAESVMARRDWAIASAWLSRAGICDTNSARTAFLKARVARKQGMLEKVGKLLNQASSLGYPSGILQREALLAKAQSGRLQDVERRLPDMLTSPGDDGAEICEAFANGLISNYRFADARHLINGWMKDFPDDPQPHLMVGRVMEHGGNEEGAAVEYRQALKLSPCFAPAAYNLGRVLMSQQKWSEALEAYEHCATCLQSPQPAILGRARCLRELGRFDEARRVLEPAWNGPSEEITQAFCDLGETREAAGSLIAAELGAIELAASRPEPALKWLETALAANPRDWKTRYQLGLSLERLGRKAEAEIQFQRVRTAKAALSEIERLLDDLRSSPDDAEARFRVGQALLEHVSESQGLVWLNSVLYYVPRHRGAHSLLSKVFSQKAQAEPDFAGLAEFHLRHAGRSPRDSGIDDASSPR